MAIKSPGTLFNLLKKAKTTYQKEPVNPKAPDEQIAYKINQGLKRLKEIAKKEPNSDSQVKPFVETKKGLLRNMKQYHKKLKKDEKADVNKKQLQPFLKTFTKLTIAVSLLDYNTVEFEDGDNVNDSALEEPTLEQIKLMEADDESAFDNLNGDGKPKQEPDEKTKKLALLKRIAALKKDLLDKAKEKVTQNDGLELDKFFLAAAKAAESGDFNLAEQNINKLMELAKKALQTPKVEEKEEDEEEDAVYFEQLFDASAEMLTERIRKLVPDYQQVLNKVSPKAWHWKSITTNSWSSPKARITTRPTARPAIWNTSSPTSRSISRKKVFATCRRRIRRCSSARSITA